MLQDCSERYRLHALFRVLLCAQPRWIQEGACWARSPVLARRPIPALDRGRRLVFSEDGLCSSLAYLHLKGDRSLRDGSSFASCSRGCPFPPKGAAARSTGRKVTLVGPSHSTYGRVSRACTSCTSRAFVISDPVRSCHRTGRRTLFCAGATAMKLEDGRREQPMQDFIYALFLHLYYDAKRIFFTICASSSYRPQDSPCGHTQPR